MTKTSTPRKASTARAKPKTANASILSRMPERFISKVDIDRNGCWLWNASLNKGYGRYSLPRKQWCFAHRFSYEYLVGSIPNGLEIDHLCRVKRCVNPNHLEPVTHQENDQRATRLITHCPAGHPYNERNTYIYGNNRKCRPCRAAAVRRCRQRKQDAA